MRNLLNISVIFDENVNVTSFQKKLSELSIPHFQFGSLGQEAVTEKSIIKFLLRQFKWKKEWQRKILELKKQYNIDTLYLINFNEKILLTRWAKKIGMKVIWVEHMLLGKWFQLNPLRGAYIHASFSVYKINFDIITNSKS